MKYEKGITIIQIMVILLIAGVVGWLAIDMVIEKRCESDPAKPICANKQTQS